MSESGVISAGWRPYELWGSYGDWCNERVVGTHAYTTAIRATLGPDWQTNGVTVRRVVELIPEPENPHDRYAVSVRASNHLVGYLARDRALLFHNRLMDLLRAGLFPVVPASFRVWDRNFWDDERVDADLDIQLDVQLAAPHLIVPGNEPPSVPYTLLPQGGSVQVTRSDGHFDVLKHMVNPDGETNLIVTLHDVDASSVKVKRRAVEVRADGHRIGQLTPQTSAKFLPCLRHFESRGLLTAARALLRGSAVSAQVSVLAQKAHELSPDFLGGDPVTVPSLGRNSPIPTQGVVSRVSRNDPRTKVVERSFTRALTPWQQREATKLLRAASRAAGDVSDTVVSAEVVRAVVLEDHAETIAKALDGIEDSDFAPAQAFTSTVEGASS